ncbi:hypothetical protein KCU99_g51, partial [Aureobasidium melanogenum]
LQRHTFGEPSTRDVTSILALIVWPTRFGCRSRPCNLEESAQQVRTHVEALRRSTQIDVVLRFLRAAVAVRRTVGCQRLMRTTRQIVVGTGGGAVPGVVSREGCRIVAPRNLFFGAIGLAWPGTSKCYESRSGLSGRTTLHDPHGITDGPVELDNRRRATGMRLEDSMGLTAPEEDSPSVVVCFERASVGYRCMRASRDFARDIAQSFGSRTSRGLQYPDVRTDGLWEDSQESLEHEIFAGLETCPISTSLEDVGSLDWSHYITYPESLFPKFRVVCIRGETI